MYISFTNENIVSNFVPTTFLSQVTIMNRSLKKVPSILPRHPWSGGKGRGVSGSVMEFGSSVEILAGQDSEREM